MAKRGRKGFLVVSDLHLSEGRNPATGHLSRHEDFLFGDEFCAFLAHHADSAEWPGVEWTLVINGDFMDFLQVVSPPIEDRRGPGDSKAGNSESDQTVSPRFGAKAGPAESAWKLRRIAQGHSDVFRDLGRFVGLHHLVIVSGNHDTEFIFEEVRAALIEELSKRSGTPLELVRQRVAFRPWFHFEKGVYLEHGHQYDPLNSFRTILDPRLPASARVDPSEQDHLELPIGSLFVRYVFNEIECRSPFADNIKPASRFLFWFVVHQPVLALRYVFSGGRRLAHKVRRWSRIVPVVAYGLRDVAQQEALNLMQKRLSQVQASDGKDWSQILQLLDELRAVPVLLSREKAWRLLRGFLGPVRSPLLVSLILGLSVAGVTAAALPVLAVALPLSIRGVVGMFSAGVPLWAVEALRWIFLSLLAGSGVLYLKYRRPVDRSRRILREKASAIATLTGARIVVLGHTHDTDLQALPGEALYFNSGTWTKVFSPEERMIREEKELTFVRILESAEGMKAKLMKWEGRLKEARLALVFEDRSDGLKNW